MTMKAKKRLRSTAVIMAMTMTMISSSSSSSTVTTTTAPANGDASEPFVHHKRQIQEQEQEQRGLTGDEFHVESGHNRMNIEHDNDTDNDVDTDTDNGGYAYDYSERQLRALSWSAYPGAILSWLGSSILIFLILFGNRRMPKKTVRSKASDYAAATATATSGSMIDVNKNINNDNDITLTSRVRTKILGQSPQDQQKYRMARFTRRSNRSRHTNKYRRKMNTYKRLVLGISIMNWICMTAILCFESWSVPEDSYMSYNASGTIRTCSLYGFFVHLNLSSMIYTACLALFFCLKMGGQIAHARTTANDEYLAKRVEPYFHIAAIVWPFSTGIFAYQQGYFNPLYEMAGTCWLMDYPPNCSIDDAILFSDDNMVDSDNAALRTTSMTTTTTPDAMTPSTTTVTTTTTTCIRGENFRVLSLLCVLGTVLVCFFVITVSVTYIYIKVRATERKLDRYAIKAPPVNLLRSYDNATTKQGDNESPSTTTGGGNTYNRYQAANRRKQIKSNKRHKRLTKEVGKQAALYVGGFIICFIWLVILQIIGLLEDQEHMSSSSSLPSTMTTTSHKANRIFILSFLAKFCGTLQGFFNFWIFIRPRWNELTGPGGHLSWLGILWSLFGVCCCSCCQWFTYWCCSQRYHTNQVSSSGAGITSIPPSYPTLPNNNEYHNGATNAASIGAEAAASLPLPSAESSATEATELNHSQVFHEDSNGPERGEEEEKEEERYSTNNYLYGSRGQSVPAGLSAQASDGVRRFGVHDQGRHSLSGPNVDVPTPLTRYTSTVPRIMSAISESSSSSASPTTMTPPPPSSASVGTTYSTPMSMGTSTSGSTDDGPQSIDDSARTTMAGIHPSRIMSVISETSVMANTTTTTTTTTSSPSGAYSTIDYSYHPGMTMSSISEDPSNTTTETETANSNRGGTTISTMTGTIPSHMSIVSTDSMTTAGGVVNVDGSMSSAAVSSANTSVHPIRPQPPTRQTTITSTSSTNGHGHRLHNRTGSAAPTIQSTPTAQTSPSAETAPAVLLLSAGSRPAGVGPRITSFGRRLVRYTSVSTLFPRRGNNNNNYNIRTGRSFFSVGNASAPPRSTFQYPQHHHHHQQPTNDDVASVNATIHGFGRYHDQYSYDTDEHLIEGSSSYESSDSFRIDALFDNDGDDEYDYNFIDYLLEESSNYHHGDDDIINEETFDEEEDYDDDEYGIGEYDRGDDDDDDGEEEEEDLDETMTGPRRISSTSAVMMMPTRTSSSSSSRISRTSTRSGGRTTTTAATRRTNDQEQPSGN